MEAGGFLEAAAQVRAASWAEYPSLFYSCDVHTRVQSGGTVPVGTQVTLVFSQQRRSTVTFTVVTVVGSPRFREREGLDLKGAPSVMDPTRHNSSGLVCAPPANVFCIPGAVLLWWCTGQASEKPY